MFLAVCPPFPGPLDPSKPRLAVAAGTGAFAATDIGTRAPSLPQCMQANPSQRVYTRKTLWPRNENGSFRKWRTLILYPQESDPYFKVPQNKVPPPRPLRCNLGVYPLARRTGTQTHRSLLFLQAHGCSQYSARTLSNRHRYMQVIRETGKAPGCVTSVFQPGTNLKTRRTA